MDIQQPPEEEKMDLYDLPVLSSVSSPHNSYSPNLEVESSPFLQA